MALKPVNFKSPTHLFGQLIIGPPGSGKTTYCHKMSELLKKQGRKTITINLDPANDILPYQPDIDISTLINIDEAMMEMHLGPNGSLIFCIEYLEKNFDWLREQIATSGNCTYFLFDLPGQVELYAHHESLNRIFERLRIEIGIQVTVVHLVDSHHCSDAGKFISSLMLSLTAMLRLGLPHVNVLSKADLLRKRAGELQFGLDFYTEVLDLEYLLGVLDNDPIMSKYCKLNSALVSIIEDYSLVSFILLDSFKEENLNKVKNVADRANGFGFNSNEKKSVDSLLSCALGVDNMHESIEEKLKRLQKEEANIDKMITKYKSKTIESDKLSLLHQYNDLKDAAQAVMGLLADIERTTVSDIHKRYDLQENKL